MMSTEHSASDNGKLIIASFGLIALCISLAGALPAILLIIGLVLAWRSGDAKNLAVTARIFQALLLIGAVVLTYNFLDTPFDLESEWNYRPEPIYVALASVAGALFCDYLWTSPLTRKVEARQAAKEDEARQVKAPAIIQRESRASFSTADELKKWLALKHEGAITEEAYQVARAKILNLK